MSLSTFKKAPKVNNRASMSLSTCLEIPKAHPRHIKCSSCGHRFYVPITDKSLLVGNYIPLLLPCGHPICSGCVQQNSIHCSLCDETMEDSGIKKLPVNLYTLGLILSSSKRLIENDDQEFAFCETLAQRLNQIKNQEFCHECESPASVKCMQCLALYCSSCYSKMHKRALQNHTQILLVKDKNDISHTITTNCSSTCFDVLNYFCNDCGITGCSNCMLLEHKMHNYVTLQEKNKDMMAEFKEVSHKIAENLQRVVQTKQKLKSTLMLEDEPKTYDAAEMTITKHFARLHGILQNMEAKLLDQLHHPHKSAKNNIKEINMQLQKQEQNLSIALRLAAYTKENFNKVDMQNAIKVLSEMADVPCHLVGSNCTQNETILFTGNDGVLMKFLENHYVLKVPQESHYKLLRMEELPESHEIEPLVEDPSFISMLNQNLLSKTTKSSNISVTSNESTMVMGVTEPENASKNNITSHQVEIVHINSPSSFFVRYLTLKEEYAQLERDLREYAEALVENEQSSVEFRQNSICIVKQVEIGNWYRGRVMNVNKLGSIWPETTYNIFYIDHGYKESRIPISRIRSIKSEHTKLLPQAIRCCLHGIAPIKETWTPKSIKDFTKLMQETSIFLHIIKESSHCLYVDICTVSSKNNSMGPQSICNAMIFMKHACSNTFTAQISPSNSTNVYTKEHLVLNKKTIVTISHIKSPAEIYVLKKGQWNDNLLKLLDDLKEYYQDNTSKHTISMPEKGLQCVVKHTDDFWHRCEIVKVISEDKAEVFFVDKGYTSVVNCDVLRTIPHTYTLFTAQAIRISLKCVNPDSDGTWKTESVDSLSSIFNDVNFVFVIAKQKTKDGYSCYINLPSGEDVSRLLKSKGVVSAWERKKPSTKVVQRNIDVTELLGTTLNELLLEESESDTKSVEEETTKDPFKMEVCIKRVVAPDCIYVTEKDREKSNENLIDAMQEFYNNYCSEPQDNWSENALCAVYSAKDKAYFRAQIKEIKSPMEILVYFCDMGFIETVTLKDIQVLHQKFTKQQMHCFKVKLAGILPCGGSSTWPSLSISKLTDIIRENSRCKFFITKLDQENVCDNEISVELWVRQMKVPGPLLPAKVEINCINKMLIDQGVVLPIRDYFTKTIAVRAAEFKQQLLSSQLLSCNEKDVQWFNKETCRKVNCKIDDSSSCSYERNLLDQVCNVNISKEKHDDPKRATDWLQPEVIEEEVFHAISTNVDNKCTVYLHPVKRAHLMKLVQTELQKHIESKGIKTFTKWKVGDICIARYYFDNKWYRGKVLRVILQANNEITLNILFVDYGNEEECQLEDVTRDIIMDDIPIQCTKCIISGLTPETLFGKWTRADLDRLHVLLVEHEIIVYILQRQPTHLVISIVLVEQNSELLKFLTQFNDMKIKIEPKNESDALIYKEANSILDSTNSAIIKEIADDENATSSPKQSSLELESSDIMLKENVISGSFVEITKPTCNNIKKVVDFENILDISPVDDCVISSTPQNVSPEESFLGEYKSLEIPPNTQYIEMILCCNKSPTISYARLAENNDDMFSDVLHSYYMQYENMMSDIQENASSQPLIESFENNTSCIAKFTDDQWYRCVIMQCQKISNSFVHVMLHYIDYGNNEYKLLNLSTKNHDIHVPKKEWIELPAMVIECQFWNIDFTSDDVDLLASKLDEIYNEVAVAKIKKINENILIAEIYKNKMCQELLYAHLIDDGLYRYKTPKEE